MSLDRRNRPEGGVVPPPGRPAPARELARPTGPAGSIHDITLSLSPDLPGIPGDPPYSRRLFLSHGADGCEAAALALSAHAGTHLDLPAHFFPDGKRLDDYPADAFLLPALVLDTGEAMRVGAEAFDGVDIAPGEAVLMKTANSRNWPWDGGKFPEDFAALTVAAAEALVALRAGLVGIDALSVEGLADPAYPVHHTLLSAGIPILEGLDLRRVRPGRCRLVCLPLKVAGAEAAPVRVVLLG